MKKPWLSRTLWTNLAVGVCAFFPGVNGFVSAHPETFMVVLAIVNMVLRMATKEELGLED